jgi:aspartyl-tRNA(Asn)/glutamyl-tRNA(Gln) amidotransferase subunit A
VIPLSTSLDHVGPITRSVTDAAIVLQAVAGFDFADITCADVPVTDYVSAVTEGVKGLRVGIARGYFFDDLHPEIAAAMQHALGGIQNMVAEMREVQLEVPIARTVQAGESYAYHAESIARTPELYHAETLRRIRSGEKVTASEYIQGRGASWKRHGGIFEPSLRRWMS